MFNRLLCIWLLLFAGTAAAAAQGAGCDYNQAEYQRSITEGYEFQMPEDEADHAVWASRDLVLHVPVCLNDLDPDISIIRLHCSVFFTRSVTARLDGTYSSAPAALVDATLYDRRVDGVRSTPFSIDEVVLVPVNFQHRAFAEPGIVRRASCAIRAFSRSDGSIHELIGPQNDPEDYRDTFYRVAAPNTPFQPEIVTPGDGAPAQGAE